MEKRRFLKKTDFIVILIVLLVAAAAFFFLRGNPGAKAVVRYEEKVIQTIDLSRDQIVELDGELHVTLEVEDGMIHFIRAQCPDKICQNTGFIHLENQTAVCMPAKVSVTIE